MFQVPLVFSKGHLPLGTHYCTLRAKASVTKDLTYWQRAGDPGGWLDQVLKAWGAGLSLEAWPGALREAGAHFLSPYAQESHHLLPAEAEMVGRLRVGDPEVLAAFHLLLAGGQAETPGSALPVIGWHGVFGQEGQVDERLMPKAPEPAEGQL